MKTAILFDCEFLTAEGSPSRFWCGPHDPDPVVAQIGAVKISLDEGFQIIDKLRIFVIPKDRLGAQYTLDPHFVWLTGITEDDIQTKGLPLIEALKSVATFASGSKLWSWGKDEFNMLAISCYVEGITPPIPATQFDNACHLLLKSGMPLEDLKSMRSNRLADYYGLDHPQLRSHDALDDAQSIAFVIQHLLKTNALKASDCE